MSFPGNCIAAEPGRRLGAAADEASARPPLILLVEHDTRTRRFIATVLKYSTEATVIEASPPRDALLQARTLARPVDLLILDVEASGIAQARELAAASPGMGVLLVSGRERPPCPIPSAWRFLSIPFPTAAFLDCVFSLCRAAPPAA